MRLLHLEVEDYGVFSGRQWEFGAGLQLICGRNEAGKSTMLQLIRELLFGFPHQTPYRFAHHSGEMAATAQLELRDRRRLSFRRRKGRANTVVGQWDAGGELDEPQLRLALDGAGNELFGSVFAFSLHELAEGRASLRDSKLTEALFGGAIGGLARFQQLHQRLDSELKELFSASARATRPAINRSLQEAESLEEQIRAAAVQPSDYDALRRACEQLLAESAERRGQVDRLRQEVDRRRRRLQAWAPWRDLKGVELEIAEAGPPPDWSREELASIEQLEQQRARREEELAQLVAQRQERERQLNALPHDAEILAWESQISTLQQDVGRIQRVREQLPLLRRRREKSQEMIETRLQELRPEWRLEDLDRIATDGLSVQRLESLADEVARSEPRRLELEREIQRLQADLEAAQNDVLDADQQQLLAALDQLGEREATYLAATRQQAALTADAERLEARCVQLNAQAKKLAATGLDKAASVEALEKLLADAPTPERIEELQQRIEQCEREASADSIAVTRVREELERVAEHHSELGAAAPPDHEELQLLRVRRQLAWKLLREHFVEGLARHREIRGEFLCDPADLAHRFDDFLTAADEAADQRQAQADDVKTLERLRETLDALQRRRDSAQQQAAHRATELESVRREWLALWQPLGIEPAAPAAMVRWVRLASELLETRQRAAQLNDRRKQCAEELAAFEQAIRETRRRAAPTPALQGVDSSDEAAKLLDWLRQLRGQMRQQAAEQQHLRQRRPELQRKLEVAQKSLADWTDRVGPLRRDWRQTLESLGLPAEWTAHEALNSLRQLAEARAEAKLLRETETQLEEMHKELSVFRSHVQRLGPAANDAAAEADTRVDSGAAERTTPERTTPERTTPERTTPERTTPERTAPEGTAPPAHDSPEQLVRLLAQRLQRARQAEQRRADWEEELTQRRLREQEVRERLAEVAAQAAAVADRQAPADEAENAGEARSGASGDRQAAVAKWRHLEELQRRAEALRREVQAALGDEAPQAAELEAVERETLESQYQQLKSELQKADQERERVAAQLGAEQNRLSQMDGSDRASEVAQDRESRLVELAEQVDRWAPLMLARSLMEAALQRFEKQEQPAILAEVGSLLQRMTGGRYVSVQRQLDREGTLRVVDGNGKFKTPSQLSTGAREQLYLAIRLAYVRHYCQTNEPLPVVMDDVLVNFDEQRARRTLEVLEELAQDVQILLLTCHRSTARLVAQTVPNTPALLLSQGGEETIDDWLNAPAAWDPAPS